MRVERYGLPDDPFYTGLLLGVRLGLVSPGLGVVGGWFYFWEGFDWGLRLFDLFGSIGPHIL